MATVKVKIGLGDIVEVLNKTFPRAEQNITIAKKLLEDMRKFDGKVINARFVNYLDGLKNGYKVHLDKFEYSDGKMRLDVLPDGRVWDEFPSIWVFFKDKRRFDYERTRAKLQEDVDLWENRSESTRLLLESNELGQMVAQHNQKLEELDALEKKAEELLFYSGYHFFAYGYTREPNV